jgi:hypothetical protein
MGDAEGPGRTPGGLGAFVLRHVQCVEVFPQGHEQVAVLGVLFGNAKAEDVTVEGFGPLEVRHPKLDMSELLELDHRGLRVKKDRG